MGSVQPGPVQPGRRRALFLDPRPERSNLGGGVAVARLPAGRRHRLPCGAAERNDRAGALAGGRDEVLMMMDFILQLADVLPN